MAGGSWLKVLDVAGMDAEGLRALVGAEMPGAGALRLRNARPKGDALAFWRSVGEALGGGVDLVEDSVTGKPRLAPGAWMDVRFEPDRADTYRHHKVGQPLHTDGAYSPWEYHLEFGLFYLARQARSGGESLFIDAGAVAERVARLAPGLHEALTGLPVQFGKHGVPGRTSTILYARDGRQKVNWNYFRVLPGQGEAVDRLREDFRAFLEAMVDDGAVASFRLEEGDAVFFRDAEVLHGRRDFAAEKSGDRLLWKTYFTPEVQAKAA
jgi:alpha-ketoglutarate-dependent taurine dioxygenase